MKNQLRRQTRPAGDYALVFPSPGRRAAALDGRRGGSGIEAAIKRQRFDGESTRRRELSSRATTRAACW